MHDETRPQRTAAPFVINRMAGAEEDMNVKTRALRHEVHGLTDRIVA